MKVKIDRREFLDAVTLAQTVVPVKSPQPVLQNVKMVASGNFLEIIATDWEVALRHRVEKVEILEEGEALLPMRQLAEVLREMSDESVSFTVEDRILTLTRGNDYFKVQGDDPSEYPEIPAFEEKNVVRVDPGILSEMIKKTVFAAAREKMRYALNGVLFQIDGSVMIMVATDGKRLAKIKRRIKGKKGLKLEAIVPTKGIQLLEKVMAEEEEPVRLNITENQFMAATGKAILTARLVEGQFPNYEDVIPKDMNKKIELSTAGFLVVLRQASAFTSPESMAVKLTIGDNKVILSSQAADLGEAKVEHAVEYDGPTVEVGYNPVFLKDVLGVLGTDTFTLELRERTNPAIIKGGEDYLYVVMPVNII